MTSPISRSLLTGPDSASTLSFSNNLLASGFENGSVCLWSPTECSSPLFFLKSSYPCSAISLVELDSSILYCAHGKIIISWDLRKLNSPMNSWEVSKDDINCIDSLESERCLATADDTGSLNIISIDTGIVTKTLDKHDNICSVVKFRSNYVDHLISAGLDCRLVVSDWRSSGNSLNVFEMSDIVDISAFEMSSSDSDEDQYEEDESDSNFDETPTTINGKSSMKDEEMPLLSPDAVSSHNNDANIFQSSSFESVSEIGAQTHQTSNSQTSIRVASSFTSADCQQFALAKISGKGLPLNPPMIHSMACTSNGEYISVGLESGTVELFNGKEKHLKHVESLFGHTRGVSALLTLQDTFLLSGGNDANLFLWEIVSGGKGQQIAHSGKISALAGQNLSEVYLADSSPDVQVVDLSRL